MSSSLGSLALWPPWESITMTKLENIVAESAFVKLSLCGGVLLKVCMCVRVGWGLGMEGIALQLFSFDPAVNMR